MSTLPPIQITRLDADRLDALLDMPSARQLPGLDALRVELERADVVEPAAIPADVATMNSRIKFVEDASGKTFELTLVYPKDMDSSGKTISILAPVGSALLGLSQGDEIEWPKPGGGMTKVKIEQITYQPERAGDYHR